MYFNVALENNEVVKITISQLRAIQVRNEVSSFVKFYDGRKTVNAVSELTMQEITDKVQDFAGNTEAYGDITFKDPLKFYEYHHRISILRKEDNTACQRLCPLCGSLSQIYHTQICNCKVSVPFTGKLSTDKNGDTNLTRQVVELDLREGDFVGIQSLFNKHGEYKKEKPVSNIRWDEYLNVVVADFKIKGSTGVLVYTDQLDNLEKLEEKRYNWYRISENMIR